MSTHGRRRRGVEDWRREVLRSRQISDGVRVLLLMLVPLMDAARRVSVLRSEMARTLGISERRVSERLAAAREAGFLTVVVRGQKGRRAVYQGVFPDRFSGTHGGRPEDVFRETPTSTLKGADGGPPEAGFSGTPVGPPSTTANLPVGPTDRDVGYGRGADPGMAASHLTACGWHDRHQGGPQDCTCGTHDARTHR